MTIYKSAIDFRAELRDWQIEKKMIKRSMIVVVTGKVFGDKKGFYKEGETITIKNITVSDYKGRYVIGDGKGKLREYYYAYEETRSKLF